MPSQGSSPPIFRRDLDDCSTLFKFHGCINLAAIGFMLPLLGGSSGANHQIAGAASEIAYTDAATIRYRVAQARQKAGIAKAPLKTDMV